MIDIKNLKSAVPVEDYYSSVLGTPSKTSNDHWIFFCPFHDDQTTPNLAVYFDGGFNCFCCGANGGDVFAFHQEKTGNAFPEVLNELARKYLPSLLEENKGPSMKKRLTATYPYKNENGDLIYQVLRYDPKDFRQRRPDGNGGWVWNLSGIQQVPYRLPELLNGAGSVVYIPGGEKDVETLVKHGLTATTNSGGEGSWKSEFNKFLQGRDVVVLEDNDEPGRRHGKIISESLHGTALSVKIIRFDEMVKGSDISDYLVGRTVKDLQEKIETCPLFTGSYSEYFSATESDTDQEDSESHDDCGDGRTQAQLLIDFTPGWELFRTPDGELFITFPRDGHEETHPIKSKEISLLLIGLFFQRYGKPPSAQALTDTRSLLEAKAQFGNKEHPVFIRTAELNGNIYLDLCNNRWEVVEITSCGWGIIPNSPVKFIRTRAMQPIPHPIQGGSINSLRQFVNATADQWKLIVGFLVTCLRTKGPFPILCIQGEQGSGKSFICRLLKSLIDPSKALLKTLPTNERDLVINAKNCWILTFDNLSGLKPWISDALCRLSTGGGFATRELYTDFDEIIFDSQRPQILNGIDDIAVRADLRDRSLIINLAVISRDQRKDEESIREQFEKVRSSILGSLLDAVSAALQNKDTVKLDNPPRMADFSKWVMAAESGLGWESGSFMNAYNDNLSTAVGIGLESDVLAQAMIDFQKDVVTWDGTATELLNALEENVPDKILKSKLWPKAANTLSNRLKRLAPVLREVGIEIVFGSRDGKKRSRIISIRKYSEKIGPIGQTVRQDDISHKNKGLFADDDVANGGQSGTIVDDPIEKSVCDNILKTKEKTDADDGNDDLSSLSSSQTEWEIEI